MKKHSLTAYFFYSWIILTMLYSFTSLGFTNAVSQSLGNAGVANIDMSASPHLNPAVLPYFKGYSLTSSFFKDSLKDEKLKRSSYNISLTDRLSDTLIPTSFGYQNITLSDSRQENRSFVQKRFQLSVGNFLSKTLSMGFGLSYYQAQNEELFHTQSLLNTGLIWAIHPQLGLAWTLQNFKLREDSENPEMNLPTRSTLGVGYLYRQFLRLRAEISSNSHQDWSQPLTSIGMENFLNQWIVLRWGFQNDSELKERLYGAGIGFFGPQFSIHYAYQANLDQAEITRHAIDFSFPLW